MFNFNTIYIVTFNQLYYGHVGKKSPLDIAITLSKTFNMINDLG